MSVATTKDLLEKCRQCGPEKEKCRHCAWGKGHVYKSDLVQALLAMTEEKSKWTAGKGGKPGRCCLTRPQQLAALKDLQNGVPLTRIAQRLNVSRGVIYRLKTSYLDNK